MHRYEVGYEDEMIGVYYAETEQEAKDLCREDILAGKLAFGFVPDTPVRERLRGYIASRVD